MREKKGGSDGRHDVISIEETPTRQLVRLSSGNASQHMPYFSPTSISAVIFSRNAEVASAMARQVEVRWSKPHRWDRNLGLPDVAAGIGIYQITRVWSGWESLLYLGIVWSDTRTFLIRMQEHRKAWLAPYRGINYRFGLVVPLRGLVRDRNLVEAIEGALIFETQPPENTSKKNSYSFTHDLVITNRGNKGQMPRIVDMTQHY